MRILALLPDQSHRVLARAIGPGHVLAMESSAASAVQSIRARRFDALVFDPGTLGDEDFARMMPALRQKAVPVLLYTALTPANARRIVEVADLGAHDLVLRDDEDAVTLLAQRLFTAVAPSAPALLLSRLAKRLHRFPDALRTVAVGLFGGGPLPRWVNELAHASGFARRTVDRWMLRGGIDGAATLLDTARLARVWEPLVEQDLSTAAAAEQCGYGRTRLLVAHARRIVGVPPSEFREALTRETFAERMAKRLFVR